MNINSNYTIRLGNRNIVKIMKGSTVIWEKSTTPVVTPDYFYIKNTANGSSQYVYYKFTGTPSSDTIQQIEYSFDKQNWNTVTLVGDGSSHNLCGLGVGVTVYLRNRSGKLNTENNFFSIFSYSAHEIGGDISTLLDYTNPNVSLPQYGLKSLFMGDGGIRDASNLVLPWMTLTNNCYQNMFRNCSNLTLVPQLPATTLANNCYQSMFQSCSKLVNPPVLPATTLVQECYYGMFLSCSLVNNITVYANDNSATNCTYRWLEDVAATGTFYNNGSATYTINSGDGIPQGWTEVKPSQVDYLYIQNTYAGTNDITFTKPDDENTKALEYSKDLSNWTSFTPKYDTTYKVTLNQGEKLYLRGSNGTRPNLEIWGQRNHIAGGNVNTLLDYTNPNGVSLPQDAFRSLFNGDLYLTDASNLVLPATRLSNYCYSYMFYTCSSLTTTPTLPATTLAPHCYDNMFGGCSSLTTAPALPATTLAKNCYAQMFYHSTSLTTAPELPATTLAQECYSNMFNGCTSLNSVTTYANDISATDCITNWLNRVASSGTFYNNGSATYTVDSVSGIPQGWTEVKPSTGPNYFYIENVDSNTGNVSFKFKGTPSADTIQQIEWSKDKTNWTPVTLVANTTTNVPVSVGEKVYFRNSNRKCSNGTYTYLNFGSDINTNTGGELYTLLDYTDENVSLPNYAFTYLFYQMNKLKNASDLVLRWTTLSTSCYYGMFSSCTTLTVVPTTLPATTLADSCYADMFSSCYLLTTAPSLPATTLADSCYSEMFYQCQSLTTAPPSLPATTLAYSCYKSMFISCTSLTTAPSLPATTLANYCYQNMFFNCVKLTTAPELPATTLTNYCYYSMFQNCQSLTTAPTLPATTLTDYCYYSMFQGCTKLTSAPTLPATTLAPFCYYSMFQGCTKLTSAPTLPATTLTSGCYRNMFRQCTSLTTAPSLPSTTLGDSCYEEMFENCFELLNAPTLPATKLGSNCYNGMFINCRKLTSAPTLPATTLASGCYENMFNGCSLIDDITTYANDISANGCLFNWLANVASSGTFHNLGSATYPSGASGIPTGWTEVKS